MEANTALTRVRFFLCIAHTLNFLMCSLGNAVSTPMHAGERQLRAKVREKWGFAVDWATTGLQHLTICSLGLLVVYLLLRLQGDVQSAAMLAVVVLPLQTMVGILYWSLALYDPFLLFPRGNFPKEQDKADSILRQIIVFPSFQQPGLVFFWLLMHMQHTVAPCHLWIEVFLGELPTSGLSLGGEVLMALSAGLAYLLFNMFCWRVRGIPAYPFQARLALPEQSTLQAAFYAGCATLCASSAAMGHDLKRDPW
jgi:hypothetical protein